MKEIDFSTYDFPILKTGKIIQERITYKKTLIDYLLNLIKCDFDETAKLKVSSISFQIGQNKYSLTINE